MKTVGRRLRTLSLTLFMLVGVVLGSTGVLSHTPLAFADSPTGDSFTIDATSGGAIDAAASHNVNDGFLFDVILSAAPDAYSAYQANVSFNPTILAWDGNPPTETNVGGATLCGGGSEDRSSLYDGCAKSSGTSSATGVAFTWGMKCIGGGTSPLHLLTDAEAGGPPTGTNFALSSGIGEPTGNIDALVTCVNPTPPPPPPPPTPGGEWAPFTRCPVDDPAMLAVKGGTTTTSYCVAGGSASGSIKLGNATSTTGPTNLQFGLTGPSPWVPIAPSGGAIVSAPVEVPGGLLGLMCPSLIPAALAVCNLITSDSLNTVTAVVEAAGAPSNFSFEAGLGLGAPILNLPIKVHLQNSLLGSTCYIGSDADPIVLRPANTDMSGSTFQLVRFAANGALDPNGRYSLIKLAGATQGDSQFAVPGASGCGVLGALNPAINLKEGLPSASGNNYVVLENSSTFALTFADPFAEYPILGRNLADDWHAIFKPNITPGGCAAGDTDCDGCSDSKEIGPDHVVGGQRDPASPWDFYDVPVPALRDGPGGPTLDHGIGITTDVVALLRYTGLTSNSADYKADRDGNGVADGVQYDRTLSTTQGMPWRSRQPDGGIGVTTDVLAMLAQSGNTCM